MFFVIVRFPLSGDWESKDEEVWQAAGKKSESRAAIAEKGMVGLREHIWTAKDFDCADELKKRLEQVPEISVSLLEK